jgi:hypothetical protein
MHRNTQTLYKQTCCSQMFVLYTGRTMRWAYDNGPKQRSQWSVIGWVTKVYYLEHLRASEGTLSRWSRLHLLLLAPTPVSRRVDVRQAAGRKK